MHPKNDDFATSSPHSLARLYAQTLAGYLLIMWALWAIGLEGIYGHPTPFYALLIPAPGMASATALALLLLLVGWRLIVVPYPRRVPPACFVVAGAIAVLWLYMITGEARTEGELLRRYVWSLLPALGWQLPALGAAAAGAFLFHRFLVPALLSEHPLEPQRTRRLLWGLFGFSVAFACAIAMIRGGLSGIDQAYSRSAYEYIGDIGKTNGIRALFTRYLAIHEYLSMHAKVHPPGPIALLWLMSYVVGNEPFPLSMATILFGCLGIFPLYGWAKRIAGQRCALIACMCYTLAPSIVIFTATSADALFTPFTLSTLYCFERALRTRSARFAVLAGWGYGCMMLLKFSLIGIGAYFGFAGVLMLLKAETRWNVLKTAALMGLAAGIVLGLVYLWSGFDILETFRVARHQFDLDQHNLDLLTPRLPAWTYRLLNPMCWFYFAGIPLSLLAIRELFRAQGAQRGTWVVFGLTLFVLNLLYLARGEGERSALYLIPFVVVPAACQLDRLVSARRDAGAVWVSLLFLAFQCWFTETFFYTYW